MAPERPPPALTQPSADEDPSGHGAQERWRLALSYQPGGHQVQAVSQCWNGDLPALPFLQPPCHPHSPLPGPTLPPFSFLTSFPPSGPARTSWAGADCTLAPQLMALAEPLPCSRPWVCPLPHSSFLGAPWVTDHRSLGQGASEACPWVAGCIIRGRGVDQDSPDAGICFNAF